VASKVPMAVPRWRPMAVVLAGVATEVVVSPLAVPLVVRAVALRVFETGITVEFLGLEDRERKVLECLQLQDRGYLTLV
jgi:hypothetical protein